MSAAEAANLINFTEDDQIHLQIDLKFVPFFDIQRPPQFDWQDDPAEFAHFSDNSGCFHTSFALSIYDWDYRSCNPRISSAYPLLSASRAHAEPLQPCGERSSCICTRSLCATPSCIYDIKTFYYVLFIIPYESHFCKMYCIAVLPRLSGVHLLNDIFVFDKLLAIRSQYLL